MSVGKPWASTSRELSRAVSKLFDPLRALFSLDL